MKVAALLILFAALTLAVLTGSCQVQISGFSSDASERTSTSALAPSQLPPPTPPTAAIKRAARPAAWTAEVCGAVKGWDTDWEFRTHELDHRVASADGLDESRSLYVDFWDETVKKTDQLLREFDAAGHPAVRGGERIARAYRLIFAKTFPPMEMARAVAAALPDDPARFSAGLAEIRRNMARVFARRDDELFVLHTKLYKTLPSELRHAMNDDPVCRTI